MIYYTLQGPIYKLEIHDDKIKLVPRGWAIVLTSKNRMREWRLSELTQFQICTSKFVWGKLEWSTGDGSKGSFRFTTNTVIVAKIEKYLQKLIIKNLNRFSSSDSSCAVSISPSMAA
jgi:hypothetical protein